MLQGLAGRDIVRTVTKVVGNGDLLVGVGDAKAVVPSVSDAANNF